MASRTCAARGPRARIEPSGRSGRPCGASRRDRGGGADLVGPLSGGVLPLGKDEGPDASGEGNAMMVNGLGHLGAMARGGAQAV